MNKMTIEIANAIGVSNEQVKMKPVGFARIVGADRLFSIHNANDRVIADILKCEGLDQQEVRDVLKYRLHDRVLLDLGIYTIYHRRKRLFLLELPMSHLEEFTAEEIGE